MVTALSRALMGRHYLGDVMAGLLVGVATTAIVTKVGGRCSDSYTTSNVNLL